MGELIPNAVGEFCPHCQVNLQGAAIAEDSRKFYLKSTTHYSRTIGVQVLGVYDGVLFWQCPDCGGRWNRWTPEHGRRYEIAEEYIRGDHDG
jgi:Zn-finger nucleic acid-binding protein